MVVACALPFQISLQSHCQKPEEDSLVACD